MIKITPLEAINELQEIRVLIAASPDVSHLAHMSSFLAIIDSIDEKYFHLSQSARTKFILSRAVIGNFIEGLRINPRYNTVHRNNPFEDIIDVLRLLPERPQSDNFDGIPFIPQGIEKKIFYRI